MKIRRNIPTTFCSAFLRRAKMLFILSVILCVSATSAEAAQRRPVDSQHPLWLVHIDVWNQADPQKIIDLIPDDIKPYVCMNLSLSCAYDTELNIHQRPQNAIRTYKSWASVCQMNNMWFTCQPASGGHTHIHENDLETFEYFFKKYPNFLGWNYAEQFWGFNEAGDLFSASDVERIALFAKLIPMHHKYGGFLTVSFCGNVWSHHLNPVGMMKRNPELLQACKDYPESILWLYKYTTSSCFYNNESVSFGPFVAGLTRNYGVRYDNCGWNGATSDLVGENACKYPVAAGIGTVMEQTCQNGGAVWDGPELIWTEDFQNKSNTNVTIGGSTYTCRNWGTFPGFRNAWIDMWRKIVDGTMYIPTQQEVIDKTKIIIINDVTSGSDEDKYAAWGDLYDGLYKVTDPFNKGNGQWMNNYMYMKRTGRFGTIPITPCLTDMSNGIPKQIKKSTRNTVWSTMNAKQKAFVDAYPAVNTGDMFVSRYKNQLVTYTPYSYLNTKKTSTANIPLQYNTCESIDLTYSQLSSGIIKEYKDDITVYLNNFRTDTTTKKKDIIVVNGVKKEPSFTFKKRENCLLLTPTAVYDALSGTYTITVEHDGPIDLFISCSGDGTDRKTDIVSDSQLEIPAQPDNFYGILIIEAEDMEYKNVQCVETFPYGNYNGYRWVRGHSGNGFTVMGSNTGGSLAKVFKVNKGGNYRIAVRYTNTDKNGNVNIRVNSSTQTKLFKKTASNEWRKDTVTMALNEGSNTIYVNNTNGIKMMVDQVILSPADEELEQFDINLRQVDNGVITSDAETAEEGKKVTITATPDRGYALAGWNIIHGNVTISQNEDGTYSFIMPDDIVTLEPVFKDNSAVYSLDYTNVLAGTLPEGWLTTDGTDVHEYPNNYGSGSRTMTGFAGTYNKGLYWRNTSAEYGKQEGHRLNLKPGNYTLTFAMAAWKGAPQYKAQIITPTGSTLKETTFYAAAPNANGTTSANLSGTVVRKLDFTVQNAGNYVIKFQSNGNGYTEYLLLHCVINQELSYDPADVNGDGTVDVADINAIISVICGTSTNKYADVNGDGQTDVADINAVINTICGNAIN